MSDLTLMNSKFSNAYNVKLSLFLARALLFASVLCAPVGCQSMRTVIVDLDFDVQVGGRDAEGRAWRSAPGEISKQRDPKAASIFSNAHYAGKIFEWRISADPGGFGYFIRSNVPGQICFRFDQARLSSNMQRKEIPMRVSWARYGPLPGPIQLLTNKAGEHRIFDAPSLCANETSGSTFGFIFDLSELFPTGKMFNINQSGNDLEFSDRGTGNWLKLYVPIEYEGKREQLEVTLTSIDSRARNSYH